MLYVLCVVCDVFLLRVVSAAVMPFHVMCLMFLFLMCVSISRRERQAVPFGERSKKAETKEDDKKKGPVEAHDSDTRTSPSTACTPSTHTMHTQAGTTTTRANHRLIVIAHSRTHVQTPTHRRTHTLEVSASMFVHMCMVYDMRIGIHHGQNHT